MPKIHPLALDYKKLFVPTGKGKAINLPQQGDGEIFKGKGKHLPQKVCEYMHDHIGVGKKTKVRQAQVLLEKIQK